MFGTGVATSTVTGFLDTLFNQGVAALLYVWTYTWPYIIVISIIVIFYALARSTFHRRGR